jgi:hypothetical protein
MLRALSTLLLVFSILSLIVHFNGMFEGFAVAAITGLALDILLSRLHKESRVRSINREQIF